METNKFNGTNYNDWLRNLRIVLDFENQGYVLDKPLPTVLPEGSSPEEHLTFEKWHEDNRKVRSIILASMTNESQKQYDRLENVPSIMLRMKEVYAVSDRHIRYAATKAFFGTKMAEGSSVQSHGWSRCLPKKLEDLKVGLENDTYIDVILQSLPPSYDPFIVNYNMNGLEKSIHELINMLVQYEAMTHKSEPVVLVGETSTSKAKGKGARRWKRNKGKGTAATATASTAGASPAAPKGKGKGKVRGSQQSKANDVCIYCQEKRHWKRECPQLLSNPEVLERSRKLIKDEMILRLGDGKVVAAEAVGSLSLVVSNLDNHENAQIWHARLGHISKDRIRRLVDSKNLEIDDLDHLPTCESCLKGKMTKKPFVGQSVIANSLLGLVHTDVYGPLSIPARGGFSYFITFTDDHSRLEVENQTNRKIKALRSDRGGEYLSGEFIDYLKENGILSQLTPPGTPQLNGVAEKRNRTLLDMVRSMMSFTELPSSFWATHLRRRLSCVSTPDAI
ncbi:UNVERIFIED_CONTAM: transposon Ty1-A Gag-Pol polyprotein [Sesamum latifolium]|uniref:Transposon Ty1-A Gag-Pol polyprotein n=1 Tax=Sesamum latifolium TaxID=2727402 RepID=A0AAW2U7C2_9LAMI